MKQQLIVTRGLPASGKSTYSKKWVEENPTWRIRVNRDDIRRQIGPYWIPSREKLVTKIEEAIVLEALYDGYSVIIDATNFKFSQTTFDILKDKLEERFGFRNDNIELVFKDFFNVSIETCIIRDKQREFSVGEKVIRDMYEKYKNRIKP